MVDPVSILGFPGVLLDIASALLSRAIQSRLAKSITRENTPDSANFIHSIGYLPGVG